MKVSIITATFNSASTILDCIQSLNNQTHTDIEHIIIDGVSTDNTLEIIHSTAKKISNIISEPDGGIYDALNKGIQHATGDIIGFLHSDDALIDENCISLMVAEFTKGADIVYGDMVYVKKNNSDSIIRKWISKPFRSSNLKYGWMPPHTTFYCKKSVYDKHGRFNLKYTISADYDLMLRILKDTTLKSSYLHTYLVQMRLGGISNNNFKNILQKMKEDYRIIKSNKIGCFGTLICKNIRKLTQFM